MEGQGLAGVGLGLGVRMVSLAMDHMNFGRGTVKELIFEQS
jgi:hypothetical protein